MSDIQIVTKDEAARMIKNTQTCQTIGKFLMKLYPTRKWYVNVVDDGSLAWIACADISLNYGVAVSLMGDITLDIETKVRRAAGEILERFRLSRDRDNDNLDNVLVDANGESIHAKQGYA